MAPDSRIVSAMKMRRLNLLLVVWAVLVIAPALLIETGVFGRADLGTAINGAMAGAWIVGYLAQFAVFMWIVNVASEQRVLWWFIASLAPWAVDWSVPPAPWSLPLWAVAIGGVAFWIGVASRRENMLQQGGIRATGIVLEVLQPWMNVVINNVYIKRTLRLRIERSDDVPAYEARYKGLFMLGEIPSPGDKLPLVVDPTNPQRFEYLKGADTATGERESAPSSAGEDSNVAEELEKLARLRQRGVLSESEFNAAKKKALGL